jgi:hypothetical protein
MKHGTVRGRKSGCDCEPCVAAGKAASDKWNATEAHHRQSREWVHNHAEQVNRNVKAHQRRRRVWLNEIKLDRGCTDCGYKEHPEALQFDHVRGEKKFGIGTGYTRSKESVLAEIEKCEVVCANCHAVRTANRRSE